MLPWVARRIVLALVVVSAVAAAGCGGDDTEEPQAAASGCPADWTPGWQALANEIDAPVYCPAWLPSPLTGEIDGEWNAINSVDDDRSYLVGFIWFEQQSGEVHVNFRGYPGQTEIPLCPAASSEGETQQGDLIPCFGEPEGQRQVGDLNVTVYTKNLGADVGHILYAWELDGSLHTLSEHIAPPATRERVYEDLDLIASGLALIGPETP